MGRSEVAEIALWARSLIETVQCFGTPLVSYKKTFYRGVSREFMFNTMAPRFNLPLSTSVSAHVALRFSDGGLILKLSKFRATLDVVMHINCGPFSCHDENEFLFFGGDTILRIGCIMQAIGLDWNVYDKYIKCLEAMRSIVQSHGHMSSPHCNDSLLTEILTDLIPFVQGDPDYSPTTPQYILKLLHHQISSIHHIHLHYTYLVECNWMPSALKYDGDSLDFKMIAVLFENAQSITYHCDSMETIDWGMVAKGLSDIYMLGLRMTVRFELQHHRNMLQ